MRKKTLIFTLLMGVWCFSQDDSKTSDYILGEEEELMMVVAVWGEVRTPGEYRVPYNTNLVEVLSVAGGPTRNARLSAVQLTRQPDEWSVSPDALESIMNETSEEALDDEELKRRLDTASRKIIVYDVNSYLGDQEMLTPPPVLQPGDVVHVRTNSWYWWRETIRVTHEIALIASIYAWYLRAR